MGSCVQVTPWEMIEEGETADRQQQQQYGGPSQPGPYCGDTANMAGDPNATAIANTQLPALLQLQVGYTIGAANRLLFGAPTINCPLLMQPTTAKTMAFSITTL